jgi:hypothetical protein
VKYCKSISTTNLVKRSFGEEKRRSKVIPRFFDEKSGLKLVFASLIRTAQCWNRLKITFDEQTQILASREKLDPKAIKEQFVSVNQKNPRKNQQVFSRKIKTWPNIY